MRRIEARRARRDQRFDQSPFVVGQIARILQLAAVVTGAVFSRPHGDPFSNQATTLESQMIHLIQELFGQTLRSGKRLDDYLIQPPSNRAAAPRARQ
jgi:hypothetical protein